MVFQSFLVLNLACFKVEDGGGLLRLWWVAVGDLLTPVRTGLPVRLKTTHNGRQRAGFFKT